MFLLDYVTRAVSQTGQEFLIVLGPMMAIGLILHYLSKYIRTRAAGVMGRKGYIYLTAPGVMVHELGHAFFCVVFFHKIIRMQLFSPRSDGTLGQVDHSFNPRNTYQKIGNFFIGTGPLWFGTAVIYLLSCFVLNPISSFTSVSPGASQGILNFAAIAPRVMSAALQLTVDLFQPQVFTSWRFWLFIYLVFCIASHMTLSPPDISGAWRGFISLLAFILIFNLLTLWLDAGYADRAVQQVVEACIEVYAICVFVIGLNVALAAAVGTVSMVNR